VIELAKIQKKKCLDCGKSKSLTEFYMSRSNFSKDNHVDYCKTCLTKNLNCEEIETVLNVLRIMDYPFIEEEWNSTFEKYGKDTTFGNYLRKVGLKQWNGKHYSDSIYLSEKDRDIKNIEEDIKDSNKDKILNEYGEKWGYGYDLISYKAFEKKLSLLEKDYPQKSAMHTEALYNYIRLRVKEELCTADGDIKGAKDWGTLAAKAATEGNISPSKIKSGDLENGITAFGELAKALEQSVDIIEHLPKLKERPQDKADIVIWLIVNYVRDILGKEEVSYEEIYKFYDDRVNEMNKKRDDMKNDI